VPSTCVLSIDPVHPERDRLREAAAVLRAGGLVAFPTETVYGLGANALDEDAVRRVFAAKGRPTANPLIVHVTDETMVRELVADWPTAARALAGRFWPGPLTLVLPKGDAVPDVVTAGGSTVAVRAPGHPVALALIREVGVPLAAPSANRSGQLSPTRAEHVLAGLDGRIDLILDGGPTPNGIESTVLDLTTPRPTLLRPGPIGIGDLEAVVGQVERQMGISRGPLPSPGLMPRHYAPRTPLELHRREALPARIADLEGKTEHFRVVFLGDGVGSEQKRIALPADPDAYAARLYDVLHHLDSLGLSRILVELPPDTDPWMAVRDRLIRAATK
jgi:L-threonylcarbamoyladenylate synthase